MSPDGSSNYMIPQPTGTNGVSLATDSNNASNNFIMGSADLNGKQLLTENGMVLGISPFTMPWNWGKGFNADEVLSYAWSQRKGQLLAHYSPYN